MKKKLKLKSTFELPMQLGQDILQSTHKLESISVYLF